MKSTLARVDELLVALIKPILAYASVVMVLMVFTGVVSRSVFKQPLFGVEELILLIVIWVYMLGAALASRERSHLTAAFLPLILSSEKALGLAEVLSAAISFLISLAICYWCYQLADWSISQQQTTPVFGLPWAISQSAPLVCSSLMSIYALRDFVMDLAKFNASSSTENGGGL